MRFPYTAPSPTQQVQTQRTQESSQVQELPVAPQEDNFWEDMDDDDESVASETEKEKPISAEDKQSSTEGDDVMPSLMITNISSGTTVASSLGNSTSTSKGFTNAQITNIAKLLFKRVKFFMEEHMEFGSIVSNHVLEKLVGGIPRGMSKEEYCRSI